MSRKPCDAQLRGSSSIFAPEQVVAEAARGGHIDVQRGGFQRLWLVLPRLGCQLLALQLSVVNRELSALVRAAKTHIVQEQWLAPRGRPWPG